MTSSIRGTLFPGIMLVLVGVLLSGCSAFVAAGNVTAAMIKTELYPPAYVDLPFQAGVKGTVLETQFRVLTTESYTFYLDFHFRDHDRQDYERVSGLTGTAAYPVAFDRSAPGPHQIDTGLPVPVRLRVGRIGGPTQWSTLDADFSRYDRESAGSGTISKIITGLRLGPGDYQVQIEALNNIPELNEVQMHFAMHTRHILH